MSWQKTADAVVIGGGMMGMATAYYLAKLGMKDVVLLEKIQLPPAPPDAAQQHSGLTWGGELNIILGNCKYEKLSEELGMDIGLYQNGYLFIAYSDEQVENFKKCIKLQNSLESPRGCSVTMKPKNFVRESTLTALKVFIGTNVTDMQIRC